jgi:hypothetical protein
MFTSFFYEMS